ncbi:discoidin domain-containing protein [Gluconobacter cerinus]|uniref:discoidin domain-containing protein n=1 Tax=Gluconobacter cerinus TaxID=38307 RepID=UPI001B8A8D53|nr:discoidin domain-containing protein [Gluconobacter cerinus]MBS1039146.1 discoidin domain-containing protein [Gluconobacter cerinus]
MDYINSDCIFQSSSQASPKIESEFSSQREWFPWWQVSFKESVRVEGMRIEGFLGNTEQPPLMSVLISDDGENWLTIWTQPFYEPDSHAIVSISFQQIFSARHIRLRYDTFGSLSFTQIVFETSPSTTNEKTSEEILSTYRKDSINSLVVFSALFNESDDFLDQYIDNFLSYTSENIYLALNFPSERTIPRHVRAISPRVHVFNGKVRREKWGNTLLLGHIEAFEEAKNVFPSFNYFATMASNALMVREMDIAAAIEQLSLACRVPVACERSYERDLDVKVLEPPHDGTWMWHHFRNSTGLGSYLSEKMGLEKVSVTQIEGLFARRQDWEQVNTRKNLIEGLEEFISFENYMAIEELLPTSIFDRFGTGQYTHICRVLWSGTRQVTVKDLLEMVPAMPDHFCALKWFDRSRVAQSTVAVTTSWGRNLLDMGQKQHCDIEQFQKFTLAKTLLAKAYEAERFGPLTNRWWQTNAQGMKGFTWSVRDLLCHRQHIELDIPDRSSSRVSPAYLFMEATNQRISISINIRETAENETVLRLSCSALTEDGAPVSGVHLQGYLYLSGLQGDTVFCLSLSRGKCFPYDGLSRTVFHDEHGYTVDYADRVEHLADREKRYFVRQARGNDGQVWLGLPIQCNATVEVGLSVGPNYHSHRSSFV